MYFYEGRYRNESIFRADMLLNIAEELFILQELTYKSRLLSLSSFDPWQMKRKLKVKSRLRVLKITGDETPGA